MTDKYQNKYRISSARAQLWDYSAAAAYFITICTHNRQHFFGKINNGELILNDMGKIARLEWLKTPELRRDMNLELGEFVVMPNHFHAVIIIHENVYNCGRGVRDGERDGGRDDKRDGERDGERDGGRDDKRDGERDGGRDGDPDDGRDGDPDDGRDDRDAMHRVSVPKNRFAPQSKNLASIVRGYKSAVTTRAKKMGYSDFAWQTRFHDRIIRDTRSFNNISKYISNNPLNWGKDRFL